ncbi:hypothetical protein NQZ68_019864 [Dissostichus eleginoides]|nr:hypothetical protein NQZ68_019864 [Dissostichus eleginoides]
MWERTIEKSCSFFDESTENNADRAAADPGSRERPLCVSTGQIGHFCTLGSPSSPGLPPGPRTRPGLASLKFIPDKETLHWADSSMDPRSLPPSLQQSAQPLLLPSIPSIDPK